MKIFYTFATLSGVLAQLARALDWQSKGQGFDSPILHKRFAHCSLSFTIARIVTARCYEHGFNTSLS